MENGDRKLGPQINHICICVCVCIYMYVCVIMERKNTIKQNKIGHLKIKNYKFKKVENLKFNEDNSHQIQ
jgi:hypothetical protein